jgi:hypothetical protein
VAPCIEEHIGNRVPHFSGCLQDVNVATIGEDRARSVPDAIHRARESRDDGLQSARQIMRATRLDDQVHMVALDRILNQTEPAAVACLAPASLELVHQLCRPKLVNFLSNLECHVARMPRRERLSPTVGIASPRPGFPPRAGPRPTPLRLRGEI